MVSVMLFMTGCQKEASFNNDLGLDTDKVLIESLEEGEFILPVYSNTDWKLSMTKGADWLSASKKSGEGTGFVKFTYGASTSTQARIAEIEVKASTGKAMKVIVIQAGSEEKASDVELEDIMI